MAKYIATLVICLFVFNLASASCDLESDKDKIARSQYVFIGRVKAINSGSEKYRNSKTGTKLRYLVRPEKFLKGYYYSKSPLKVEYSRQPRTRPHQMIFSDDERYIFAVTSINNEVIKLDGFFCSSWGWHMAELPELSKILQTQNNSSNLCIDTKTLEECIDCCTSQLWPASTSGWKCPEDLRGADSFNKYRDQSTLVSEKSLKALCTVLRASPKIVGKGSNRCRSSCLARFKEAN